MYFVLQTDVHLYWPGISLANLPESASATTQAITEQSSKMERGTSTQEILSVSISGTKGPFLRVVDRHRVILTRCCDATRPISRWTSVQTRRTIPRKSNRLFEPVKASNRFHFWP